MLNDRITVTPKHEQAADVVIDYLADKMKPKFIITIGGEVGSGKSTLAYALAHKLKKQGIRSKIIDLDDFYKIPPLQRKEWRRAKGIESVGPSEYNWGKIIHVINDFYENQKSVMPCVDLITDYVDEITTNFEDVNVIILNGLYATKIEAQIFGDKEEMTAFRKQILEREHEMVQGLKKGCDLFFDFDALVDKYHL
jgi:uridine kinase